MAAFVAPKYRNSIFSVVDPSKSDAQAEEQKQVSTLKHLGYEDSVVNHILLIKDIEKNEYDTIDLDRRASTSQMSKRFFTVQGIQHIESLTLNFIDLDIMK